MPTRSLCVIGLEWYERGKLAAFPTVSEKVFAVKSAAQERLQAKA